MGKGRREVLSFDQTKPHDGTVFSRALSTRLLLEITAIVRFIHLGVPKNPDKAFCQGRNTAIDIGPLLIEKREFLRSFLGHGFPLVTTLSIHPG